MECAWTSFLLGHPRLATYGLTQGEERSDPFRLWWARFHLLERLVAFGYNPMYVDTDVSFRVNPYPLLKGPFARFALVGQDETGHVNGVNIGFVYAQNARAGGPAHRVLNETVARMFAILEHAPGPVTQWDGDVARGAKEHLWDQHIYNDVLERAVFSRDLRRRSGARLIDPSGNERQAWNDAEVNAFPRDTDWESFEVVVRPTDVPLTKAGTKMALEPGRFQARGARLRCVGADVPGYATREEEAKIRALRASNVTLNATSSSNAPTPTIKKRVPRSCVEPELFLASPAWFLAGWSGVAGDERFRGVRGGWNLDPPIVAVAHAVGALAKQQTFKQLGWWQYGAEAFQRGAGGCRRSRRCSRGSTEKAGSARRAPRAAAGADGGPGCRRGSDGEAIARLVTLAVALGRRPAIPEIACDSPWIAREPGAFLGIKDREHVVVGARCDARGPLVALQAEKNEDAITTGSEGLRDPNFAEGSVSCCATVNFACDEGVVWQVDLDRDPRYAHWRERKKVVDVSDVPRVAGEPSVVDVAATSSFFAAAGLDDAPLLVLDLAGSDGVVPDVGNVSPEVAETVNLFFYACDRLDCRPPRRPFPTDVDPCRVPR